MTVAELKKILDTRSPDDVVFVEVDDVGPFRETKEVMLSEDNLRIYDGDYSQFDLR